MNLLYAKFKWAVNKRLTKIRWRKKNSHNLTQAKTYFDIDAVTVGKATYGMLNVLTNGINAHLTIGNYCSIADNVTFILSAEHPLNTISTYPFKAKMMSQGPEALSKGNITVADDVWICNNSLIMSGVNIGQGAVVAAGSVVTKDVPPYAIVGGVPAKVIKYRFTPEMIAELMRVDYSKLDKEMVREHIVDLYSPLKSAEQIQWLPTKP